MLVRTRGNTVPGRQYLVRQAATLLQFAKSTNNSRLSAALIERAAALKSQVDGAVDQSLRAPDVQPEEKPDGGNRQA
jgi:hypothetical protein